MAAQQNSGGGPNLTFKQQMGILLPFAWDRILEQIKCVWFVLAYLMLFQILVLGLGIVYSLMIAVGIVITIVGLAFFMEGLRLGLMPLGEILGSTQPWFWFNTRGVCNLCGTCHSRSAGSRQFRSS
jgi:hypothetical protein